MIIITLIDPNAVSPDCIRPVCMDDFLASRSLKALPLQTAKADIAVLFPFVCYLSRFSSILRTWPMIRFTVSLGHCVMSFFQ